MRQALVSKGTFLARDPKKLPSSPVAVLLVGKWSLLYQKADLTCLGDPNSFLAGNLACFIASLFFWLCFEAYGILVPQSGTEPRPLAVKAPSPNHWTTKELPSLLFCAGQGQDDSFTCPAQQLKMLINSKFFIMSNLYLSCFNTFPFSSLSSVNRGD